MHTENIEAIPRVDFSIVAQIKQLESVRPGLAKHLLEVFERNAIQFFADIEGLIARGDRETLRVGFHSMKGTSASLGAQRLSHIAGIAEQRARDQSSADALQEVIQLLKGEFEAARLALAAS